MSEQRKSIFQRAADWWYGSTQQKAMLDLHPELADRQPLMRTRGVEMWVASEYNYRQATSDHAQNVWMSKAVKLISDAIAPIPMQVVQDGKPVKIDVPLIVKPNGTQAGADVWRAWATSMLLGGDAGLEVVKAKDGTSLLEWWARSSDEFQVVPDPKRARYGAVAGYIIDDGAGDPYTLPPEEFIHFKFFNPRDKWRGVSPFAAARLSMRIDRHAREWAQDFFENSARPDFAVMTPEGTTKTERDEILAQVLAMYRGTQTGAIVLEQGATDIKTLSFSPKEINFVEQREMSRDEVAAAAGIPDILMGFGNDSYDTPDKRTNAEATMWSITVKPLLDYRDQVLTAFFQRAGVLAGNQEIKSDLSSVMALQQRVDIFQYHIDGGIVTRDEVRQTLGFGDNKAPEDERMYSLRRQLAAMQAAVAAGYDPITAAGIVGLPPPPENPQPAGGFAMAYTNAPADRDQIKLIAPAAATDALAEAKGLSIPKGVAVPFGSDLHRELWELSIKRADPYERRFAAAVAQLFERQKAAVIEAVRREAKGEAKGEAKSIAELGDDPFDEEAWARIFAQEMLPEYRVMIRAAGNAAMNDVGAAVDFNLLDPRVIKALRQLSQRFAKRVNETTWRALKAALEAGIRAGEGADKLAARVEGVMTLRVNQSSGAIARTEVQAANSAGALAGWTQAGVEQKTWIATFDDRVRDTHAEAHGQTVGLDEDFTVGTATGPGPGQMDEAGETINCRCAMLAVTK